MATSDLDTEMIVAAEEVNARLPRDLYCVTFVGRTPKGRRKLVGLTARQKGLAEARRAWFEKNKFEDVKVWHASLEWTEVSNNE